MTVLARAVSLLAIVIAATVAVQTLPAGLAPDTVRAGSSGTGPATGPGPSAPGTGELASEHVSPPPAPARSFDIVASGDLLIHTQLWERALQLGHGHYDFRPMFASIRPIIRHAALAICHVETPIGAPAPVSSYPIFNAPVQLAAAIKWTGWDACSTASNHTVDKGQAGVNATLSALDRAGVRHSGSYRSATAAKRILMLSVQGIKVAFLAYTYGTNGIPPPTPWTVNLISLPKIVADARRAHHLGADLVIVNFHWGNEYTHTPNEQQTSIASYLLRRHIVDAVIGQHVHVVQPIRRLYGRYVVFGEGNLVSGMLQPEREDGLIADIHVQAVGTRATVTGIDYVPTWVEHPDDLVLPVGATLAKLKARKQGSSALAAELRASYQRTVGFAGRGWHIHPIPARIR